MTVIHPLVLEARHSLIALVLVTVNHSSRLHPSLQKVPKNIPTGILHHLGPHQTGLLIHHPDHRDFTGSSSTGPAFLLGVFVLLKPSNIDLINLNRTLERLQILWEGLTNPVP